MDDVKNKKVITLPPQNEVPAFPNPEMFGADLRNKLENAADISSDVADALIFEAEILLKTPKAVSEMPSVSSTTANKFLVAS